MRDGTYTGVVDRIVDGETAVILLEADGEVVEQVDVPVESLPEPARDDGGVLSVTIDDDQVVELVSRPEETRARRESIQDKLDRLSRDLSDDEG